MVFHLVRIVFIILLAYVGSRIMESSLRPDWLPPTLVLFAFLALALTMIAVDHFTRRKSLIALTGVFFGLVVGMVAAYGCSLIVDLILIDWRAQESVLWASYIKTTLGIICCYFSVSFVVQTKDDFRFIIPYVEFTKQRKGGRPVILDTSVVIDGRIYDIADTRVIENELIVPRFVLLELQTVADSSDKLKRMRGRRGLEMLNKLQSNPRVDVQILDVEFPGEMQSEGVDQKLLALAQQMEGRVMTIDYNLNKVAQLRGVEVININDLANALKPVFLPGERMNVKLVKPGEESDQGVGYLDDGTMVVASAGRAHIGEEIELTVTSVLQTSAGRMIFGKVE